MDVTTFTTADGTRLSYKVEGSGSPAMIFVHGWCSNMNHWAAQADHFAPHHRILRYDRRGHGRSDAPATGYTAEQHASDLAELAEAEGIRDAIVVAHAGGGPTGLIFASRFPELASALVGVDAGLYSAPGFKAQTEPMIASLGGQDHDERMQEVYSSFFHPRSDRAVASRAVQEAMQTPAAVAVAEVRSLWVDTQDIAREIEQPVLWIRSGPVPRAQAEAVETCLQNGVYAQTVGVGHFPQLEDPDQVNAMIARFLKNL